MSEGIKRLILPQLRLRPCNQTPLSTSIFTQGIQAVFPLSSMYLWKAESTGLSAPLPSPSCPHQAVSRLYEENCHIRFVELVMVYQQIHCFSTSLCYTQTKRVALSYNSNSALYHQALYNHRSRNVISQSNSDFQALHKTKTVLRKLKSQVRWYKELYELPARCIWQCWVPDPISKTSS